MGHQCFLICKRLSGLSLVFVFLLLERHAPFSRMLKETMIINFVPNGLVLISNLVDPHVWLVHDALLIQTLGNPYYFVISGFQLIYPKNFSFVLEGGVVYPGFTLRGGSEGPCFSEVLCHKILYI